MPGLIQLAIKEVVPKKDSVLLCPQLGSDAPVKERLKQ
jgi:hypothetical protein